ncbi:MAG TPA: PilC/PilY family type IV pilus protein [Gammaproteobacteria bacterium]|nr:PilC/PilY family type IV pilus protein [Gammaproteobacteria bacterium]
MKTMKRLREFCHGLALSVGFLPAIWSGVAQANLSGAEMGTFTATPILTVESVPPLVMLAMSMDHQYFIKAYNDYTDLNKDGVAERTYLDSFEYYGYFHSDLCYKYSSGDQRFKPVGKVDDPRVDDADTVYNHYCTSTEGGGTADAWSGNFLNWATMTRMDIVRKILYGGYRSTDTATTTVLERANLPGDAHSFAKYYNGADLAKLTPHDLVRTDTANGGDVDSVDDDDEGITICNTTYATAGSSHSITAPPIMRVAKGNFSLWAANERRQCTFRDEFGTNSNSNDSAVSGVFARSNDPNQDTALLKAPGDKRNHNVRVEVCSHTLNPPQNLENCASYGANRKPEGLLQKYGLDGQMQFALVTGSKGNNLSGGRLKKRMTTLNDEVDTSDGTFEPLASSTPGIIKSLNAIRIYGYGYDDGTYLPGGDGGIENCDFQLTEIKNEGKCASWGNPMSEIYLEALRYFGSTTRSPTAGFNDGGADTTYIPDFVDDTDWDSPVTEDNSCASLNAIIFNASVSSYDDDETDPDFTASSAEALTEAIGAANGENLEGKNFFVGRSGAAINEFCTSKTIDGANGLGDVYGLCPEAPTVRGSYHMAGLAHYAHTEDLMPGLPEKQTVKTFAVSLATGAPIIDIPVSGGKAVKVLPAYRLRKGGNSLDEKNNNPANDGGGALVDFKIVRPHTEVSAGSNAVPEAGTGIFSGLFYVNWEDSEQGGDYDQDMWGMIEYRLDTHAADNQLTITTTAVTESTNIPQLFGFITSGTTKDGFHAYSGIEGANYTDPTGVKGCNNCRPITGDGGSTGQFGAQSATFTISTTASAELLESPLYYAAKWGGFKDSNDNKRPDVKSEWDADGDGVPDTFYFVTDPGDLESSLREVFDTILERVSSGTAAAVVANEQQGNGVLFQALYDPEKSDGESNSVRWIGTLHALFVDKFGLIREDGDQDGQIDGFDVDRVVKLVFDNNVEPSERRTKLVRYVPKPDDPNTPAREGVDPNRPDPSDPEQFTPTAPVEIYGANGLKTVWNARERLSDLDEATITTQRAYGDTADEGRYILTWMDDDFDTVVDSTEVKSLVHDTVTADNFWWLDTNTRDEGRNLVDWVRGKQTGLNQFRKRSVDYDGGGEKGGPRGVEIMRLGDIIHSTPVSVGAPSAGFDQSALDASYARFRERYQNRRQVVYVGANDGMIHAFNAGFFNADELKFELAPTNGITAHPLGSELWAYVPKNLLPHLQWLARQDYSHVYYMDLPIRVFDVKIFADDGDDGVHPGGWGTILVAGMRFGGGSDNTGISVDRNADADSSNNIKTKSAYVIMDVTDPEQPPKVLAEISPPNLQFTTSVPQAVGFGTPEGKTGPNKWYLVFGTGPSNLASATYESHGDPLQNANVYAYDLSRMLSASSESDARNLVQTFTIPDEDVFVGDIASTDFDLDMKDEELYFGTVGAPVTGDTDPEVADQGSLYRISMDENETSSTWGEPTRVLEDLNRPFVTQPAVTIDRKFRHWLVAASGRLFTNDDKITENQQSAYGIVVRGENVPTEVADLIDVSKARVFNNDVVQGVTLSSSADTDGNGSTSTKELREAVAAAGGWRKDFATQGFVPADVDPENPPVNDSSIKPAERAASRISLFGGVMFSSLFTPSVDLCGADGNSRLLAVDFSTGVPPTRSVFPCTDCDDPTVEDPVEIPESFDQGGGFSSSPSIHFGNQTTEGRVTLVTQDSRGELETTPAQTGAGDPAAEISWREFRNGETGFEDEAGTNAE